LIPASKAKGLNTDADRFRGKTAVVTGGSSGIGYALSTVLHKECGASVYALDKELPAQPIEGVKHIKCDITYARQLGAARFEVEGPISLLVNNAGVLRAGKLLEMSDYDFSCMVSTNIHGSRDTLKAFVPMMEKGSTYLQISSIRALEPREEVAGYGLTKAFAWQMALVVKRFYPHISVKVAFPGPVDTNMLRNGLSEDRLKAIARITVTPEVMASMLADLLRSDKEVLRYDDGRAGGSGKYVFGNLADVRSLY
jgi:short-subunit dehydrogenase